ncbi:MAG: TonB C-terminal domain-containing protein [Campylobacterales bacterium]|nr:TonB C-terminal domain-containing protein [Campylobacterales bacterium]
MDKFKVNFVAGSLSVLLYLGVVFSFILYLNTAQVKKISALNKTTVLELDIVIEQSKQKPEEQKTVQSQNLIKSEKIEKTKNENEVVKKSTSVSAKTTTDLKSLFANVTTQSTKTTKQPVLNVKISTIASRYKSKFEKDKKVEAIQSAQLNKEQMNPQKQMASVSSKDEKDPYYSQIYQIISDAWKPIVFYDDLVAKILITITSNGNFSYKFIQYSNNIGFDNQLEEFLQTQSSQQFPVNPNGKDSTIEITFQAKG